MVWRVSRVDGLAALASSRPHRLTAISSRLAMPRPTFVQLVRVIKHCLSEERRLVSGGSFPSFGSLGSPFGNPGTPTSAMETNSGLFFSVVAVAVAVVVWLVY